MSLRLPVTVFRKTIKANLNTGGQLSKISRELANFAITKGARTQEKRFQFNEMVRRVDVVYVPVGTSRSSIKTIEMLVDKHLQSTDMILALPALRQLRYRMIVGDVTAIHTERVKISPNRMADRRRRRDEAVGERRSRDLAVRRARMDRGRTERVSRGAGRRPGERNQHSRFVRGNSEELVMRVSQREMEEIESWN